MYPTKKRAGQHLGELLVLIWPTVGLKQIIFKQTITDDMFLLFPKQKQGSNDKAKTQILCTIKPIFSA